MVVNTTFDKSENAEKFPAGPTIPRPGPILLSVAATDVKLVVKSKPSRLIIRKGHRIQTICQMNCP